MMTVRRSTLINERTVRTGKAARPSVRAGDPAVTTARGGGEIERWIMDVPLPPAAAAAAAAACAREPPRPRRQPLECGSPFRLLIETKKKVTFSRPGRCAGENESLANPPLELGYSPVVCCILNPDKAKTRPRSHGKRPARHSKLLAHTFCELNNVPSRPLEDPETLRLTCVMCTRPTQETRSIPSPAQPNPTHPLNFPLRTDRTPASYCMRKQNKYPCFQCPGQSKSHTGDS